MPLNPVPRIAWLRCLVFFVLSFQTRRQPQTSVWEDQDLSFSLYLDGKPIEATSLPKPRTWLYHKRVGMMNLGAAAIREDTLKLEDVPADVGYLRFFWDENTYNPPGFAGDLIAHSIESEGQLPQVLELTRILSLTAPVSTNGKIAGGGSLYCAGLHGFEGLAIFEWEPMEDATYSYSVERIGCGGRPNVMMEEGEIGEAYLKLDLPPSTAGARYALRIKAIRGGEVVGQLFIQDQAGQADYFPFAVRASADYARKESP